MRFLCRIVGHQWALVAWRPTSVGAASWTWVHGCQRGNCEAQLMTSAPSPDVAQTAGLRWGQR